MAAHTPLTVRVLMAVGNGTPAEVGTFDLPLRLTPARDTNPDVGMFVLEVDLVGIHEGMRDALHELADAIPTPPPGYESQHVAAVDADEADLVRSRWARFRKDAEA
ncbi:hypothetical protein [Microbacterium caowuchunii]|uniref:Uncharacterized protein n=1 Tax=Microbacterium caowuchunii TaxID=2614638 RepID=A0A5N0TH20_9MICO|nr:hypothetical protein [Microbacterium caowuchunii]KAA9133748.1 hypothetical protein F6B40_08325 [Microbacterium caowuchunii]